MSLTFKNKDLYFNSDLTQYVSYKAFEESVLVNTNITVLLGRIYEKKETPENIKKNIMAFLTFVNANSTAERYYYSKSNVQKVENLESSSLKNCYMSPELQKTVQSLLEQVEQQKTKLELVIQDMDYYAFNSNHKGYNHLSIAKEKPTLNQLFSSRQFLFKDKIKLPVFQSAANLTDSTTSTVHEHLTPHIKVGKAIKNLEEIVEYLKTLNPSHYEGLTPVSKQFSLRALKTLVASEQENLNRLLERKSSNEALVKRSVSLTFKATLKEIEKTLSDIQKVYDNLFENRIDFDKLIKKPWTGSLNEEEVFNFGKAFYILGEAKGVEGFVGMKSVYNRGNSNSYTYTIVKDIKNASLFTEGASYDLGYGISETERLYVDMEFKYLSDKRSKLSHKLQAFIDKNKLKDAISALNEVENESAASTPKPKSKNKI